MMDKFNFYDIYGYLLPGFTLLALICLPFGLTEGHWPTAELSSALFAIIFAYILGHILQSIARNAISSKVKDSAGKLRYPSSSVFDADDWSLSADLKKGLAEGIKKSFGIDIGLGTQAKVEPQSFTNQLTNWMNQNGKSFPPESRRAMAYWISKLGIDKRIAEGRKVAESNTFNERLSKWIGENDKFLSPDLKRSLTECISTSLKIEFKVPTSRERFISWIKTFLGIDKKKEQNGIPSRPDYRFDGNRRDAFFLCRDVLIKAKAVSYAEQSQGMYALMMGLAVAFALGSAYHLGWSISGLKRETFETPFKALLLIALGIDLFIAILMLIRPDLSRVARARSMLIFLAVALLASGYLWGLPQWASPDQRIRLVAIALLGVFSSLACFAAEKYFAHEFAVAVYRAFYTHEKSKEEPPRQPGENLDECGS